MSTFSTIVASLFGTHRAIFCDVTRLLACIANFRRFTVNCNVTYSSTLVTFCAILLGKAVFGDMPRLLARVADVTRCAVDCDVASFSTLVAFCSLLLRGAVSGNMTRVITNVTIPRFYLGGRRAVLRNVASSSAFVTFFWR